ncbi:MAG: response regulator [Thermoguttaceae bacterium]|jgi:carbon storage regulator CsrA|nr:response regulator [Thermoguttaceae bacterium]
MLVLSRREGERIVFPTIGVTLEVLRLNGSTARLGIEAPRSISVLREELSAEMNAAAKRSADAVPEQEPRLSHRVRNQLHTATLALHLLKRQLEKGMVADAEASFRKVLEQFEAIEQQAARKSNPPEPPTRRTTLVVDDDANEAELLAGCLRMSGYEVATAGDGADALDYLARNECPDLMLLDMIMPRFDGPATVRAVRNNPDYRAMKVFAISGSTAASAGVAEGPGGVDRWFCKPLDPGYLMREIAHELEEIPFRAVP